MVKITIWIKLDAICLFEHDVRDINFIVIMAVLS